MLHAIRRIIIAKANLDALGARVGWPGEVGERALVKRHIGDDPEFAAAGFNVDGAPVDFNDAPGDVFGADPITHIEGAFEEQHQARNDIAEGLLQG